MDTYYASTGNAPARVLQIIRAAMVTAVLLFGGVTWHIHSSTGWVKAETPEALGYVILAAWAGIAAVMWVMTRMYRAAPDRPRRVTVAIIGWALGEAAAMMGAIHYFLTDDPTRYFGGLIIFACALAVFPIPPDEPAR